MKKTRQRPVASEPSPATPSTAGVSVVPGTGKGSRRRWFRLLALVGVPWFVLLVLEGGLRLVGYGYPTAFFVRHPKVGANERVENQQFSWRFFPVQLARYPEPIRITVQKPPGNCRIFVLGESAAAGDPAPAFSFSRILQVLLSQRHPNVRFEVVNAAFTAINSHVILPIARDCRGFQGNFWLVYMGNNEVIGPFGTGTIFGQRSPPLPVIRANLALKSTRTGQALDDLLQRLRPSAEAAQGWGGMSMFLSQQVRRDDPRLERMRHHFQRNLADLIAEGTTAGAKVVVSTVASRVRDWPPFASMHRADLSSPARADWEKHYQAGTEAEARGDAAEAIRSYEAAGAIDDQFAELQYRWGRLCLGLQLESAAKEHLLAARDLDTLRFRTDSRLNDAIREIVRQASAAHAGVRLLDAEQEFNRSSTNGLPGEEWFHEHVHFTFAGNYRLARLFAEEIERDLPAGDPSAGWLSAEDCAERLAYTDSQRYEIATLLQRRFEETIYRQQLGDAERRQRAQQELAGLRGAGKPVGRQRALQACRRALGLAPDDWVLHELAARLWVGLDSYPEAIKEWGEVAQRIPHSPRPPSEIGKLHLQQKNPDAAIGAFNRALEACANAVDAHVGLGTVYRQIGRDTEAIRHYRAALRLDPTKSEAAEGLAALVGRRRPSPRRPRGRRRRVVPPPPAS